jgi:hypothetical protein
MMEVILSWPARMLVMIQVISADLDPEILQWPGGSLIAAVLGICLAVRSIGPVGARVAAPGEQWLLMPTNLSASVFVNAHFGPAFHPCCRGHRRHGMPQRRFAPGP